MVGSREIGKNVGEIAKGSIVAASDIAVRGPGTCRGNLRSTSPEYGADNSRSDDAAVGEARARPKRAATALRKSQKKINKAPP